jgi:NitT/TauT family transport system permease protein
VIGRARQRAGLWSAIGLITFIAVWELTVRLADIRPFVLREPSRIIGEIAKNPRFWIDNTLTTTWHTLVGVGVSLALAVVVGAVLAAYRPVEWAVQPILVLVMVTPWVAYISSVALAVGTGTPTILFMVALVSFPPFTFAATLGMRSADVAARELLASVDTPRIEVLMRLRLPAALPSLFTAGRFTAGLGLAAAYFAEGGSFGVTGGLGEIGKRSTSSPDLGPTILWASIVCAAVLGVVFLVGVIALERRVLRWHASQRISIG